MFASNGEITPPTMWQTFRVWTDAAWAGFHPEHHLNRLRSDPNAFNQGANQLPPSGPIGLLQTGGDALSPNVTPAVVLLPRLTFGEIAPPSATFLCCAPLSAETLVSQ